MLVNDRTSLIVLLLFQGLAAGCGARAAAPLVPTSPSAGTAGSVAGSGVGLSGTRIGSVVGFVVDTAFRPLAGAKVEVLAGPDAGVSATADADGRFFMTGGFDAATPFRATSDGHIVATETPRSSSPGGQPWIVFYLEPLTAPVNIAGDYILTLAADSACIDLPDETRTRRYEATIAISPIPHLPERTYFKVTVNGVASGVRQSFSNIGAAGMDLGFDLSANHNGIPTLVEQLGPDTYLSYFPDNGFAGTSLDGVSATISTSFDGVIDYNAAGAHVRCQSANHRLIMVRR